MNDDIVHGNFYFKKKLLLAWVEFEIVINIRVCKVVLQQHIEIRYRLIDNTNTFLKCFKVYFKQPQLWPHSNQHRIYLFTIYKCSFRDYLSFQQLGVVQWFS